MIKNPNALAAWVAGHMVILVEVVLRHYFHYKLSTFWEAEITADVATVVLYVGREGIKASLQRALATLKKLWTGGTFGETKPADRTGA